MHSAQIVDLGRIRLLIGRQSLRPTFPYQADFFLGGQNSITFPRSCGGSHFTRIEDLLGM
jgi:hypothetical protein